MFDDINRRPWQYHLSFGRKLFLMDLRERITLNEIGQLLLPQLLR